MFGKGCVSHSRYYYNNDIMDRCDNYHNCQRKIEVWPPAPA